MGKNDAARRRREQRLGVRIQEIRKAEYAAGVERGQKEGAARALGLVLEHAGAHYKAGRDADASAVREVYRALTSASTVNAEKSRG